MANEENFHDVKMDQEVLERPKYVDVSNRAIVSLRGADAQDLLHRISTNDLSKLQVGEVVSTILTNERGRMVDVLSVAKVGEHDLLLCGHSTSPGGLKAWLEKFIIMEDVHVENVETEYSHYLLFDIDALEGLADTTTLERGTLQEDLSLFGLEGREHGSWFFEPWPKKPFIHLLLQKPQTDAMTRIVNRSGFIEGTKKEFDLFRVQNGIPEHPSELSPIYNPLEAKLAPLISFTKGCYVGQEVIARLDTYKKVQRILVRMEIGEQPDTLPAPIHSQKEEIGEITTHAFDEKASLHFVLGYIRLSAVQSSQQMWFVKGERHIRVRILGSETRIIGD